MGGALQKALKDPIYGIDKKSFMSLWGSPTVELGHALGTLRDNAPFRDTTPGSHKKAPDRKAATQRASGAKSKKARVFRKFMQRKVHSG
jgi:hypothetical protein